MDFLSATGRDYNTRTGSHFSVLDRRSLRNSRYRTEEKDLNDRRHEPANAFRDVKRQSLEGRSFSFQENQNRTQVKNSEYVSGLLRNSERQGRSEWRNSSLSNRSKSLDWRAGAKSPERIYSFRRRSGEGTESSRVRSTVQAYNSIQDTPLSKGTHSLPSRFTSASLGPKGGQSILQRIEKLYGSSELGNTGDYQTTEHQAQYKDWLGGSFPRRFSSGEHRQNYSQGGDSLSWTRTSGQWKSQTSSSQFEGNTLQSSEFSDIGTRSLDRARSRSSIAARIRAARAVEEMDGSGQPETCLKGISEAKASTEEPEINKDMNRKSWSRTTMKARNPVKTEVSKDQAEEKHKQTWTTKESPSDDVFMNFDKLKSIEKKGISDRKPAPLTASVRNKINQFEALMQRTQASSPRRAFSMPEHESRTRDGVQRSSSAKVIGTGSFRWKGLKEERGDIRENHTFLFEREKKLNQDEQTKKEIFSADETKRSLEKELENTKEELDKYSKLKTTLELPLPQNPQPTINVISIDEVDFSKIPSPEQDVSASSEVSTPTSDNDKTPTNTPDMSPISSPRTDPKKAPPFSTVTEPSKQTSSLTPVTETSKQAPPFAPVTEPSKQAPPFAPVTEPSKQTSSFAPVTEPSKQISSFAPVTEPPKQTPPFAPVTEPSKQAPPFAPVTEPSKQTPPFAPVIEPSKQAPPFAPVTEPSKQAPPFAPVTEPSKQTPPFAPVTEPSKQAPPFPLATEPSKQAPPFAPVTKPSKQAPPPVISSLPDLVSRDSLNGKKRVLDLNAWLDGLNPQVMMAWDPDEDDDDSTQRDEDSNYDSDSGESSVTITSVMSNKSFSVSLADLCNFAGADYDSETDSDSEWQSSGRRSVSLSSDVSGFSYVSVMPTEELDKLIEDVKSIGDNNLQDYEDVRVVVLHKDVGVGLGFSLAGGVDQNKPVTVHKVFHSGIAAQEGSVKEGDQVLSINGTALSGCAHWEALRVLRRAKGRETGVVVLKKPDSRALSGGRGSGETQAQAPAQSSEKSQCISVSLEKSDRDLGFSLEGGVGSSLGNKPLSVQKIFQGGPVDKILPGDEVLEVNGVNVVGMRRLEAWTLIRKLPPGPVNVLLRRPSSIHKT